ncbi:nuclear receptor subfamily 0 group B member 2-like isoform X2 [Hemitrygon akajei]|uniref:nuclear receptor subfamily 0 group B member 2-like isoform X2 n=1 Tax=Hemitrygon akajei TaxID=2704970 RepID=UPI003BFA102C
MACVSQSVSLDKCSCGQGSHSSILYSILNKDYPKESSCCHCQHHHHSSAPGCSCEFRKKVVLKTPEATCRLASEVLLKTLTFIKNLPSFCQLPEKDQVLLMQNCWAPLFVLGLAQERVDFEVVEAVAPSLLRRILLNQKAMDGLDQEADLNTPTLEEVQRIKLFLVKFWSMDISTKEYAYLKGITLFNPARSPAHVERIHWHDARWRSDEVCPDALDSLHSQNSQHYFCHRTIFQTSPG